MERIVADNDKKIRANQFNPRHQRSNMKMFSGEFFLTLGGFS